MGLCRGCPSTSTVVIKTQPVAQSIMQLMVAIADDFYSGSLLAFCEHVTYHRYFVQERLHFKHVCSHDAGRVTCDAAVPMTDRESRKVERRSEDERIYCAPSCTQKSLAIITLIIKDSRSVPNPRHQYTHSQNSRFHFCFLSPKRIIKYNKMQSTIF